MVARAAGEAVAVAVFGHAALAAIRAHVARILSLDIDGGGFADVVGRLRRRYPGLRPVLFLSPDEAVARALIGNRIRVVQAAQLKARLARELGEAVDVAGVTAYAFPDLSERKVAYLQHSGRAATGGLLDAASRRALCPRRRWSGCRGRPASARSVPSSSSCGARASRTGCRHTRPGWPGPSRWPSSGSVARLMRPRGGTDALPPWRRSRAAQADRAGLSDLSLPKRGQVSASRSPSVVAVSRSAGPQSWPIWPPPDRRCDAVPVVSDTQQPPAWPHC